MNALLASILGVLTTGAAVWAQEAVAPSVAAAPSGKWSEGFGRAPSYRWALAEAIEDAVAKVKGLQVARGAVLRSRLSVVGKHPAGEQSGWFDGQADFEREWVQQQLAGFVASYEVTKREKVGDEQWEVGVRALVLVMDTASPLVVDLSDDQLRQWQLDRREESGKAPFAQQHGEYAGPGLAQHLRSTRMIEIVGKGSGPIAAVGAAPGEREKLGQQRIASHRVVVRWQPLVLQSVVERPNKARPTAGPRPEILSEGAVTVALRIDDLVRGIEVLDETFTVLADPAPAHSIDRLDAFVNAIADKARATVAEKIYFALRPPTVLRKWAGEGDGQWLVEVQMSRRVATGYESFVVGNPGSLASTDWQTVGRAVLIGGIDTSCTFRIDALDDASRIEPNVTEVRPHRQ